MTAQIALVVVAALVLIAIVLSSMARRLDRLHRRETTSRATLETQLVHRAEAALVLVEEADLDPASALIIRDAAWRAAFTAPRLVGEEAADPEQRGLGESELTRALRTGLGDTEAQRALAQAGPDAARALEQLAHTQYRVELARRFHNDAVTQIQYIRRTRIVRLFRLAGRAALPQTFELDQALEVLRIGDDTASGSADSPAPPPA